MEVGIICPYKIDILVAMDARSYGRLATEKPHPRSADLDRMTPARLFDLMDAENLSAVRAVARAKRDVLRAVAADHGPDGPGRAPVFLWARAPAAACAFWKRRNVRPHSARRLL
jgi:hypothetical protein